MMRLLREGHRRYLAWARDDEFSSMDGLAAASVALTCTSLALVSLVAVYLLLPYSIVFVLAPMVLGWRHILKDRESA